MVELRNVTRQLVDSVETLGRRQVADRLETGPRSGVELLHERRNRSVQGSLVVVPSTRDLRCFERPSRTSPTSSKRA